MFTLHELATQAEQWHERCEKWQERIDTAQSSEARDIAVAALANSKKILLKIEEKLIAGKYSEGDK